MKKCFSQQKGFGVLAVFLIVVVIIIGAGGGYVLVKKYQNQKQQSNEYEFKIQKTSTIKGVTASSTGTLKGNINIKADVQTTTSCAEQGCFDKKFKACEKATVTAKLMDGLAYYYEIIGPENKLCKVKSKFTENPNPSWVGKEMVCKLDNSKAFDVAVQDLTTCQGPLADLMTGRAR